MPDKLIYCEDCGACYLLTDLDQAPEYEYDPQTEQVTEQSADGSFLFQLRHRHHRIKELHMVKATVFCTKRLSEVNRTAYFMATDGLDSYIVKRSRQSAEEPFRYEVFRGSIDIGVLSVDILAEEIRRQMAHQLTDPPLPKASVELFLEITLELVRAVSDSGLEIFPQETSNPLIRWARLNDKIRFRLFERFLSNFPPEDCRRLRAFYEANEDFGDVMNILLKYRAIVRREPDETIMEVVSPSTEQTVVYSNALP